MRNLLIFLSILTFGLILLLKGPALFQTDDFATVDEPPLVAAPVQALEPISETSEKVVTKKSVYQKKVPLRRKSKAKSPRAILVQQPSFNKDQNSNTNLPQAPALKPDFSGGKIQDRLLGEVGNAALNKTDPRNERWISNLSGPGARLSMGTERTVQNCEREGVYCPVNRKQEALIVGASVKVSPGTQVRRAAFQGQLSQGDYNEERPGLSLD